MCGICGLLSATAGTASLEQAGRDMLGLLGHRGPDGAGLLLDPPLVLGHTRLAVIDPEGGAQPLSTPDGRYWISFNGEIYNHIELRDELTAHGTSFRTHSDTEVLLHAVVTWGTECFARLNGQWALAVWDRARGEILLARDRLGIRPLYYVHGSFGTAFASEVKSLLVLPECPRELDPEGIGQTLAQWGPHAPVTAFAGVRQLTPGSWLCLAPGEPPREPVRYWEIAFSDGTPAAADRRLETDLAAELRHLLDRSARLRYERADVPVGVLVSGGLDSSITARLVQRHAGTSLAAFSIGFGNSDYDESDYQTRFASELGAEHHHVVVEDADIASGFPDAVLHAQQPLLRTAPVPILLLAREIRARGYKVVVTGDGADELFAGYDLFREVILRRMLANGFSDDAIRQLIPHLYPWHGRSPLTSPTMVRALLRPETANHPLASHLRRWSGSTMLAPFVGRRLRLPGPGELEATVVDCLPNGFASRSDMSRALYLEANYLLPDYLLSAQSDRVLMAHAVEGRFPFLDPEVVSFAASLPHGVRIRELEEKYLLRKAFQGDVSEYVTARRKQPYRAPGAKAISSSHWIDDLLAESSICRAGLFRAAPVRRLLDRARSDRPLTSADDQRLVAIASIMLLNQTYVDHRPAPTHHECLTIYRPEARRASR
ncbi:MAG: asparagine synthase (glutamine-hydrolyzing) [bacterium]